MADTTIQREQAKAKREALELALLQQLRAAKLEGGMEREFRPFADRKNRVDFAWKEARLIVEVEGGAWVNGRHNRGAGFIADIEKYNRLTSEGWMVLRVVGDHIKSGVALQWIEQVLRAAAKAPA